MANEKHSVDLSFQPRLESVSAVRRFLEVHYRRLVSNSALISRMAVTAHELLENAAKYSAGGESRLRVEVDPSVPNALSVSVESSADPRHLPDLKAIIAELSEAPDPFDVYLRCMMRAANRSEGSGLGLARIFVEADMSLKLELSDACICIEAVAIRPAVAP